MVLLLRLKCIKVKKVGRRHKVSNILAYAKKQKAIHADRKHETTNMYKKLNFTGMKS